MIHHSFGLLEMKSNQDGAMFNHGIMLGLILLLFRNQNHQINTFSISKTKKYSKICDIIQLFFYIKSNSINI